MFAVGGDGHGYHIVCIAYGGESDIACRLIVGERYGARVYRHSERQGGCRRYGFH